MNKEQIKIKLQESINWNAFFSLAQDVFQDPGFQSNADNFARATLFEMALEKLSTMPCQVERIDQDGCDLLFHMEGINEPIRVELKTFRNKLFYINGSKKYNLDSGDTKAIKMKNYRGDTGPATLARYKREKCFDFLLVIQFQPAEIILAKDEEVRPLYYDNGSDGVWVNLPKSIYTKLDVSVNDNIQRSGPMLSERIARTYEDYIMSYVEAQ